MNQILRSYARAIALVPLLALAASAQESQPTRWVRASASTKVHNVPDANGVGVAEVATGTLLAVHGERAGWLSVEPPQGLTVWVYGQFLRPSSQAGIAEVTGNNVRMRPKASSAVDSYPLEQQLHEGDRLRVLGRADEKRKLSEDWVRAIAPPGVRGWVRAADTRPLDAGEDGRAAWTQALQAEQGKASLYDLRDAKAVAAASATANASAAGASAKPDAAPAQGLWESAEKAYATAKTQQAPDWSAVSKSYSRYLEANPKGANAAAARGRIDEIGIREEIARLRADIKLSEEQRRVGMTDAQKRLADAALASDPLWGRFQARGWLERDEQDPDRWIVRWGGQTTAEIVCSNGRYDLESFRGFEVGIRGGTRTTAAGVTKVDAAKIEVLSARAGG